MAPLRRAVAIPRAFRAFDADGRLQGDAEYHERSAAALLDELVWWATALRDARARTAER
jgi:hypothetical protein